MSFQLTLLSILLLLIAGVVGQPIQSHASSLKVETGQDNLPLSMEAFNDDPTLYDYFELVDPSPLKNKRWANQVRFGKRASWASSVRFG
uniref:Uncharacterized protein n=1 Tax=Caenorhabditis japonica TaxID=281687 RepID=A0A8R1DGR9_CAEJA